MPASELLLGATAFFHQPVDFNQVVEASVQFPLIQFVELRGETPFLFPGKTTEEDLDLYRQVLREAGLRSTVHTTMYDINLATLNPYQKDANIACYKKYLDFAAAVGAEVIVVHGGELYEEFVNHPLSDEFLETARAHLCESLWELGEYARQLGIKIGLENSPPSSSKMRIVFNPESQIQILDRVNHPNVGALLDFAHAFLWGFDLTAYLEAIHPYLVEFHAHNNWGKGDDHLGLHQGEIDYRPLLNHPLVQGIPFIMEIRSYQELVQTMRWLEKVL
ncbi:MAG: sugar phosphate isomerase/epimerase [Calditrichaeota bacterium]|nr:MAG: sugar phosphate isomerase/epimerase [Calditrichota bacterium]